MAVLKILILLCSAGQPLFFVMNLCSCRLSPSVTLWQLWVLLTTVAPLNPTTSFSSIGRVRCPDVCALQSQGRLLGTLCFVFFFFSLLFFFFFEWAVLRENFICELCKSGVEYLQEHENSQQHSYVRLSESGGLVWKSCSYRLQSCEVLASCMFT